ncbi:hypothetical protein CPHO_00575 [Corynebacterium phocae]|uniref:PrsW family intramembrane metalloprotease n=1 Tax=Corynebacterium phocae TaxID=161895 RepID=A0A1L7D0R4_9CORY|nr:PrsW family intramembrane metalloprotease [Corynebacterium phocae]APT91668.1 hypothetical protein CPHO_00575 [Corynebacterium phocae]KAA8728644.1 PrsW family intramembrane metalloprotease [Corynebacterium phocae]
MSTTARVIMWISLVLGGISALFIQVPSLLIAPTLSSVGLVLTILYAVVVVWGVSRMRIWPNGRSRGWVAAALIWGSGTSLLLVLTGGEGIVHLADYVGWDDSLASFGGAWPEEISKALGVLIVCLSFRHLNRPWHAMVVGMIVGLGFETHENFLYGSFGAFLDPVSDWTGFWVTWGQRLVIGPFLHIGFTALAGWGIGWALYAAGWSRLRRVVYALGWLTLAFICHFLWNYGGLSINLNIITLVASAVLLYPTLIWLIIRAHKLAAQDPGYSVATTTNVYPG